MDSYIEIKILPDPEFVPTLLMDALYSKLHRALAKLKSTKIGISFPDYQTEKPPSSREKMQHPLGLLLRLHGSLQHLQELMQTSWLTGIKDHIHLTEICPTPTTVQGYAVFRRTQVQSSAERIRRRQMRRHNLTYAKACELVLNNIERRSKLPFVCLNSQSTQQTFKLFISKKEAVNPIEGNFNTYGLTKEATVPIF